MSAHESLTAQFAAFIQKLPELILVTACAASDIHKVDGYNTLIETPVILVIVRRRKKAAAAHAGIHITLQLFHHLGGDIVGNHALCRTLGGKLSQVVIFCSGLDIVLIENIDQLRECRRDPDALFVFHTFDTLKQRFLNDERKVISGLSLRHLVQIHEHRYERCLPVGGEQRIDLILNGLHAAFDFPAYSLFDNALKGIR
ncbi:MAG: hypothetical protein BWZ04_02962 [Firmicutes bacterium ADurb.BinA205]|nr:MAG: hypothetical protein BWZ04_02962 [Firmicutes bacterium ADurb.BinA205]